MEEGTAAAHRQPAVDAVPYRQSASVVKERMQQRMRAWYASCKPGIFSLVEGQSDKQVLRAGVWPAPPTCGAPRPAPACTPAACRRGQCAVGRRTCSWPPAARRRPRRSARGTSTPDSRRGDKGSIGMKLLQVAAAHEGKASTEQVSREATCLTNVRAHACWYHWQGTEPSDPYS